MDRPRTSPATATTLVGLCLVACDADDSAVAACASPPVMALSTTLLEFGVLELGATASARLPDYARDPRNWLQQVYLHAERPGVASIDISPPSVDFGSPLADGSTIEQVLAISNAGDGDLALAGATLDAGCNPTSPWWRASRREPCWDRGRASS